jgi:hypothetical protein
MTWVVGAAITAAQLNAHLRDNMLETAVAKATTAGSYMTATGSNSLAERYLASPSLTTAETTTSTTFDDLTTVGPQAPSVVSSSRVMVLISANLANNTSGAFCRMGVDVSGSLTTAASGGACITYTSSSANSIGSCSYVLAYSTAGTSTFTAKYLVSSGTGTFSFRRLIAMPF